MLKEKDTCHNNYKIGDPDPVTLIALCFAGIGMGAGVASAIMQGVILRRQRLSDKFRERETESELFAEYEQLKIRLRNINITVNEFRRNAKIAESFLDISKKSNENQGRFLMGSTVVELAGNSLQIWNLLVENIATDIKLMNRYVIESTESISSIYRLLLALTKHNKKFFYMMTEYMDKVYYEAENFKKLLARYHSLTPKTPIGRALKLLHDLCDSSERMMTTFTHVFEHYLHEMF